jgi:hypothetical protein
MNYLFSLREDAVGDKRGCGILFQMHLHLDVLASSLVENTEAEVDRIYKANPLPHPNFGTDARSGFLRLDLDPLNRTTAQDRMAVGDEMGGIAVCQHCPITTGIAVGLH